MEHFYSRCVSTFEFDLGKARAPCQRYLLVVVMGLVMSQGIGGVRSRFEMPLKKCYHGRVLIYGDYHKTNIRRKKTLGDWPLIAVFVAFIQISAPKHAQIAKIKALLL